jgi:myo-inositol 2-dehydrogenase/D-chiro-inositol 1-dehydrogenase
VTLLYGDGRIAVIRNSRRAAYGYDQRIELLGSTGLLSLDNVLENTVSKATADGVVAAKPEFFFLERYMRAYAAEWAAFVDAVTKNSPLPVALADGVNALAVAEAATRSAKTKSTVALASVLS